MPKFTIGFTNKDRDSDSFDFNSLPQLKEFFSDQDDNIRELHDFAINNKTCVSAEPFRTNDFKGTVENIVTALAAA